MTAPVSDPLRALVERGVIAPARAEECRGACAQGAGAAVQVRWLLDRGLVARADLEAIGWGSSAIPPESTRLYPVAERRSRPSAGSIAPTEQAPAVPRPARPAQAPGTSVLRRRLPTAAVLLSLLLLAGGAAIGRWVRENDRAEWLALLDRIAASVDQLVDRSWRERMDGTSRAEAARPLLDRVEGALARQPGLGLLHSWRGRLLAVLGRSDEARRAFERGCRLAPREPRVWLWRARWHLDERLPGVTPPAIEGGAAGLRVHPAQEDKPEYVRRMEALDDLARCAALVAGGLSPLGAEAREGWALGALHGDAYVTPEDAIAFTDGLDSPRAREIRGEAHFRLARWEEAVRELRQAFSEWPERRATRRLLGVAALARALAERAAGRDARPLLHEALRVLHGVLRRDPEDSVVLMLRGQAELELATADGVASDEGRDWLRRAAADADGSYLRAPDFPWGRLLRAQVGRRLADAETPAGRERIAAHRRLLREIDEWMAEGQPTAPVAAAVRTERGWLRLALADQRPARGEDPGADWEAALAEAAAALEADDRHPAPRVLRAEVLLRKAAATIARGADPDEELCAALAELDGAGEAVASLPEVREVRKRGKALVEEAKKRRGAGSGS